MSSNGTLPAAPGRPARFEFDYRRNGTLAYLAAWDVHHAKLFDRVETSIARSPGSNFTGWGWY